MQNNNFEILHDSYSGSDIQDYIECITKNCETLPNIPPVHIYINRANNRLVFKLRINIIQNEQRLEQ